MVGVVVVVRAVIICTQSETKLSYFLMANRKISTIPSTKGKEF